MGGDDTLVAGTASANSEVVNNMRGDAFQVSGDAIGGQDTFVFKDNVAAGQTVGTFNFIRDFSQAQDDVIVFSGVAGVDSFDDLKITTQPDPEHPGALETVITAGADQVTLRGFNGTLTAEDFTIIA
jgi:hypothetical protein